MKIRNFLTILAMTSVIAMPSFAAKLDPSDQEFMKKAADAGMTEVSAGKVAAKRATNPDVRAFAQQMVNDHGKNNQELKSLAKQKNVSLPSAPSKQSKDKIADLKTKAGKDFDDTYISEFGVQGHADAEALFKNAASGAKDPDVKNFASQTLPVVQHHREMANGLADTH